MKTKEFWDSMCNEMGFKFFTGVPREEFKLIFNTMKPSLLHYVPPTSDGVALGLASGTYIAGVKSVMLVELGALNMLGSSIKVFNEHFKIPILFITNRSGNELGLKEFNLTNFKAISEYMYKDTHLPCVLVIEEGELI